MSEPNEAAPEVTHDRLWSVTRCLPEDYAPYGQDDRGDGEWGSDCSTGCRWFAELDGRRGADWGVCANPRSHRAGLLTFEHQGCRHFEREPEPVSEPRGFPNQPIHPLDLRAGRTDWESLRSMPEREVERRAAADPDSE